MSSFLFKISAKVSIRSFAATVCRSAHFYNKVSYLASYCSTVHYNFERWSVYFVSL